MQKLKTRDLVLFALLGSLMFVSKLLLEFLPNIHLLGMFTTAYTVTYRRRALIPIYVYVMLNGLYAGFQMWWLPYLYIWAVLWAMVMLLPKNMPKRVAVPVYMAVCGLHGLLFGTLYAPAQALMYGLSFKAMLAWIVAGLPYDVTHMIGNICAGALVVPVSTVLLRLERRAQQR
jgi:energy-coupling factor transport system substrate-specific component